MLTPKARDSRQIERAFGVVFPETHSVTVGGERPARVASDRHDSRRTVMYARTRVEMVARIWSRMTCIFLVVAIV